MRAVFDRISNYSKVIITGFWIVLISTILFSLYITANSHFRDVKLELTDVNVWGDGWHTAEDNRVDVNKLELDGSIISIYNTIPKLQEDSIILLQSNNQLVTVYVDGEKIYYYGRESYGPFSSMSGNAICLVDLSADMSGKAIEITYENTSNNRCIISPIYLDSEGRVLLDIILDNICKIAFVVLGIIVGILFIGLSIRQRHSKNLINDREFWHLGIGVIMICLWILFDSGVLQFITSNVAAIFLLNCIVLTVLHIANIVDLYHSVYVCHSFILIAVIVVIIGFITERKNHDAKMVGSILAGITFFSITVFVAVILAELNYNGLVPVCIIIGVVGFMIMLGGYTTKKWYIMHDRYIDGIFAGTVDYDRITIFMVDLNYLKRTNDEYGHEAGDEIIIVTA